MADPIAELHERPPGGRCGICKGVATRWHGEVRPEGTVAVGVCDACGDALLAGRIGAADVIGLIGVARAGHRPTL